MLFPLFLLWLLVLGGITNLISHFKSFIYKKLHSHDPDNIFLFKYIVVNFNDSLLLLFAFVNSQLYTEESEKSSHHFVFVHLRRTDLNVTNIA